MPLEVQTVFLTDGWDDYERGVLAELQVLRPEVSINEKIWIGVGERPDDGWLHVTIVREKATWISSGWQAFKEKDGTYRYERTYEGEPPLPKALANEVASLLKLPESGGTRTK